MKKIPPLNHKMRELLTAIASAEAMSAEQIRSFVTHSNQTNQNSAIRTLVRYGYLDKPQLKLFRATKVGLDYLAGKRAEVPVIRPVETVACFLAAPRTFNFMSTSLDVKHLGQSPWRPGAMDAYQLPSRIGNHQVHRSQA